MGDPAVLLLTLNVGAMGPRGSRPSRTAIRAHPRRRCASYSGSPEPMSPSLSSISGGSDTRRRSHARLDRNPGRSCPTSRPPRGHPCRRRLHERCSRPDHRRTRERRRGISRAQGDCTEARPRAQAFLGIQKGDPVMSMSSWIRRIVWGGILSCSSTCSAGHPARSSRGTCGPSAAPRWSAPPRGTWGSAAAECGSTRCTTGYVATLLGNTACGCERPSSAQASRSVRKSTVYWRLTFSAISSAPSPEAPPPAPGRAADFAPPNRSSSCFHSGSSAGEMECRR